ncbi:teichoic acids export ABC transporter ATP-binding subunit TagH [Bacillus sp. NTK071]|nr:teichoic acids export ABC transporter ATP-binding subunit TagH [Bacillus sp. NTK071]
MSYSVKLNGITKKYKMHRQNSDKLKDIILPGGYGEDFYAIRDLTFEAGEGDVVGIIGVNGSGKSTFSNLVANITPPTSGEIDVKGDVSLIAVSAGLNKELTGRENIELKLLMMGYKKNKIEEMKPDIIEFADIGKFIDMPVKKYSSGMKSRLGFSISISVDPDVLIVDEALSVGDKTFADKCLVKMDEFKKRGKTIFFVSHSNGQMKKFCNKALWLEHGTIREYGPMKEVMPQYEAFIKEYKSWSKEEKRRFKEEGIKKQEGLAAAESASGEEKEKRKKSWILF